MKVIGLNFGEINSSSALIQDGELIAAAPEERFSRQKQTRDFPHQSLGYCLKTNDLKLSDCDAVAQGWNPGAAWAKFNPLLSRHRRDRSDYFYSVADNLYNLMPDRIPGDWLCLSQAPGAEIPPIYFVQHHRCHAAASFFLSPFEEAAILTCDFRGELECASIGMGRGNSLDIVASQKIPHSLGMFYAAFTELLGYRPDNDEWKVMALSAFDVDHQKLFESLKQTYRLLPGGILELDQSYFKGAILDQPLLYTQKLVELVGGRTGLPGEEVDEWHCVVAKAMQTAAEEIATHFLNDLYERTKCDNVVLGGGFFMNSVFNGKINEKTPFKNIFVPFAPTDSGNSIGAALYVAHSIHGETRNAQHVSSYQGPSYSDHEIRSVLMRRGIPFRALREPATETAELIAEGKIIAVFDGQMEFGDRALGNRSILADPTQSTTKDRINSMIKYREAYRPFAPMVPIEDVSIYFEVEQGFSCPYMEKVVPIKQDWQDRLAAVCHVDGSGRVQTVDASENPRLHKTLREFEKIRGVPIVLNTSFNINGEPMVESPDDAVSTFFNSGLDVLVLGSQIVEKAG